VFGLSGGLIGPTAGVPHPAAKLEDTPVFLGCSDIDPYIPAERVKDSARVLEEMGAHVEMVLFPGMAHTINDDEVQKVRAIIEQMME
jgi:predicted esterase